MRCPSFLFLPSDLTVDHCPGRGHRGFLFREDQTLPGEMEAWLGLYAHLKLLENCISCACQPLCLQG